MKAHLLRQPQRTFRPDHLLAGAAPRPRGFIAPTLLTFLAMSQTWFHDLRPWVDAQFSQDLLLQGSLAGGEWLHLLAITALWLVIPLALGTLRLTRSEVE